jgi:hypothetical protein
LLDSNHAFFSTFRDRQEYPVILALLDYQDSKEWRVWKGPKVIKVNLDHKDLEGQKATVVKWVCRVSLVSTGFLVFKVHQDHPA